MLHLKILDLLYYYKSTREKQQVLVLMTGDGNDNHKQTNFPITVERVIEDNWKVELWSWKRSLGYRFRNIQEVYPTGISINYLDDYRDEITFVARNKQN